MVYPRGRLGADEPFCDVFDHDVDAAWLERIRTQIIALANLCLTEATVDIESNAGVLGSAYRRQFTDNLYYDSLRLRPISDELVWKWSEATGKYIGCPYWSAGAKALFDYELVRRQRSRTEIVRKIQAWELTETLQSPQQSPEKQIIHEHVFPTASLRAILRYRGPGTRGVDELRCLFSHLAVGCVVTEEERRVLGDVGDLENPWRRYVRAGITLAHNPLWPEKHKGLIESAGLKAE